MKKYLLLVIFLLFFSSCSRDATSNSASTNSTFIASDSVVHNAENTQLQNAFNDNPIDSSLKISEKASGNNDDFIKAENMRTVA